MNWPFAPAFLTSMVKAAKANPTELLAEGHEDVVHMALMTLGGPVSPEEVIDLENLVGKFFKIAREREMGL